MQRWVGRSPRLPFERLRLVVVVVVVADEPSLLLLSPFFLFLLSLSLLSLLPPKSAI